MFFPPHEKNEPFEISICGISYCDGSYKISRQNSSIWCLEYIIKGQGSVWVDKTSFCAEEGDVYILPAGRNHYYYSDDKDPWEKIWMNISGNLVDSIMDCYGMKNTYHIKGIDVYNEFKEFLRIAKEELPSRAEPMCAKVFLGIVQKMKEHTSRDKKVKNKLSAELKREIDNITDFSVRLEDVVSKMYCTKSHAIRIFKEEYEITPYEYLLERKLSAAKQMLLGTGLSIKEISAYLGFSDSHYFSQFFKKRTGLSPKAYKISK